MFSLPLFPNPHFLVFVIILTNPIKQPLPPHNIHTHRGLDSVQVSLSVSTISLFNSFFRGLCPFRFAKNVIFNTDTNTNTFKRLRPQKLPTLPEWLRSTSTISLRCFLPVYSELSFTIPISQKQEFLIFHCSYMK